MATNIRECSPRSKLRDIACSDDTNEHAGAGLPTPGSVVLLSSSFGMSLDAFIAPFIISSLHRISNQNNLHGTDRVVEGVGGSFADQKASFHPESKQPGLVQTGLGLC